MYNDAVLYTKVSSEEQKKSGFSLDFQAKALKEYASKNDLNIVKIYAESHTAKKPGRPLFNEMLKFVKQKKIAHIVFLKADRASRNNVDSSQLIYMAEYMNFSIHLIQDGLILCKNSKPTDFLIFEVTNCMSNFYPRNLSIEVSTKLREKAEQGYYPSRPPIGYQTVKINHRALLQINPEKAFFIKQIFELYATGQYSYESLAKVMRDKGFKMSEKTTCSRRNIEDILNNPIYIGDFVYNGKRYYNAKHEAIVSHEIYSACQQIIHKRSSYHTKKYDFIFSNMIKCKKCGCYMVAELKKGKYIYYHCTGNKGGDCKKHSYVRESVIEKRFIEILKSFELSPATLKFAKAALKSELENQNFYNEKRIENIQIEVKRVKNRLDKLFNLFLDEQIDENLYKQKRKEFEMQLEDLTAKLSSYNRTSIEILKLSEKLFELCKHAHTLYLTGNICEKREIIKIVCSNFYYDGANVEIAIKKAFQPLVKIAYLEKVGRGGFEPPYSRENRFTVCRL